MARKNQKPAPAAKSEPRTIAPEPEEPKPLAPIVPVLGPALDEVLNGLTVESADLGRAAELYAALKEVLPPGTLVEVHMEHVSRPKTATHLVVDCQLGRERATRNVEIG